MKNKPRRAKTVVQILLFASVCFGMQFVGVVFLILSGLGMVVPVKAIYWITLLYQPKDYMVVGRLDFILMALAFNTAVCTMLFAVVRWSILKLIGSKPD